MSKHYLADSTLAPNVFDLEHTSSGRKRESVNITQLHRAPGTEFLFEDSDRSTPHLEVSSRSSHAPLRMMDGYVVDDIIALKHPTQPENSATGIVTHANFDTGELSIHY